VPADDPTDLLAVADAAIDAIGGLLPLQYETLGIADFERATPNFGHRALALLLAEGAVSVVLLWNWDTCIERSALEGERVEVARTLDDMQQLQVPSVAKIHGCATRPETLLITSAQLEDPPLWTDETFKAKLRGATAAFVGIGDVADYAKRRITQLTQTLPTLDIVDIYVISPDIASEWDQSGWADLLPALDAARRVPKSADELLDELARVWAIDVVETLEQLTASLTGSSAAGVASIADALRRLCGTDVIAALRVAAFRQRFGDSVLRSPATQEALVALGVMSGEAGAAARFFTDGHCRIADEDHELLITVEAQSSGDVRREAFRRAEQLAARGRVDREASFVVAGVVVGQLDQPEAPDIAEGEIDADDVFVGPRAVRVNLIAARDAAARAA
jgi:hypothetical protein